MAFEVPEIGKRYSAAPKHRPVLILTSNSEKNLPDAFLRRCVFFHIPFPSAEELEAILTAKISDPQYTPDTLRNVVLPHFLDLRNRLQRKKPGTAELLHWIVVLIRLRFDPYRLHLQQQLPPHERDALLMSYHVLAKNEQDLALLRAHLGYTY